MIEINEIFSEFDKRLALWCGDANDTCDLASVADEIIENRVDLISVIPESVGFLWACLEKQGVKILTRFDFSTDIGLDKSMSDISEKIISVSRQGAGGTQLFMGLCDLDNFVDAMSLIRDDLFFEHDLCIAIDILEIDLNDWERVFKRLRDIRADAFVLYMSEDMGNRSDFVGRIYAMLEKWDFDGQLHFVLNNDCERMDQVINLVDIMRPELADKLRFFIEY